MKMRALTFRTRFADEQHNNRWWITLGHPDEMECTELMDLSLEEIHNLNDDTFKKDSASSYHHVIYLIEETASKKEPPFSSDKTDKDSVTEETANGHMSLSDSQFWEASNDFLAVTRIHFPDMTNHKKQFDQLRDYFDSLSLQDDYRDVSWRVYYTMELSDMVLVSKSKTFQRLANWSLLATSCHLVGSAYTYFCIPGAFLKIEDEQLCVLLEGDNIDFMSVRFAVHGAGAKSELQKVREILGKGNTDHLYRISGNEDAIICGRNVPIANLIKLYRIWYKDENLLSTFHNIITRIGTNWNGAPFYTSVEEYPNEKALTACAQKVLDKVQTNVLNDNAERSALINREWMRPLVELTNALIHMSKSSTVDEPALLILPALNAFWDNVSDKNEPLSNEPLYLRFAELSVHTMEHLMRAEGQLSQHPELRPLAYDTPVFVLEYATTFLLVLSNELTKADTDNAGVIKFLLVPSAEKDVSTVELFRAKKGVSGLLVITVPFSFLYKPKQLIPALCHELAHYVGETLRMRELRYNSFIRCVAMEIVNFFWNNVTGNICGFVNFIETELLNDNLKQHITLKLQQNEQDIYNVPLLNLVERIYKIANELLDPEFYAELTRLYVMSNYRGAQFFAVPKDVLKDKMERFKSRIRDLSILFRETYADICLQYFLDLSPVDYLEVSLRKWEGINTSTLLRIYTTLRTARHSDNTIRDAVNTWGSLKDVDGEALNWALYELDKLSELVGQDDSPEQLLTKYISQCWNALKEHCPQPEESHANSLKQIYKGIMDLDCETSYEDILKIIDDGRQITLNQLRQALAM